MTLTQGCGDQDEHWWRYLIPNEWVMPVYVCNDFLKKDNVVVMSC